MPDDGVGKAGTQITVLQARIASLEAELEAARARIAELEAGTHKTDRRTYLKDYMREWRKTHPRKQ